MGVLKKGDEVYCAFEFVLFILICILSIDWKILIGATIHCVEQVKSLNQEGTKRNFALFNVASTMIRPQSVTVWDGLNCRGTEKWQTSVQHKWELLQDCCKTTSGKH